MGNSFSGQTNAIAIYMYDISGSAYGNSANIVIGSNIFTNYYIGIDIEPAGGDISASQTNVVVTNNLFTNVSTTTSIPSSVGSTVDNNP